MRAAAARRPGQGVHRPGAGSSASGRSATGTFTAGAAQGVHRRADRPRACAGARFDSVGTPRRAAQLFDQTVAGPDAARGRATSTGPARQPRRATSTRRRRSTRDQWDNGDGRPRRTCSATVETQLDARHRRRRPPPCATTCSGRCFIETGLLLGMLLLAILFAWLVARSMARSLRELRQGALAVAQYGLPQAVARLRDPALASQLSPGAAGRRRSPSRCRCAARTSSAR